MAAFETNADDALAAWPIRGLARRFPAKDLATLEVLLRRHGLPSTLQKEADGLSRFRRPCC